MPAADSQQLLKFVFAISSIEIIAVPHHQVCYQYRQLGRIVDEMVIPIITG
jgi:hypothetical protein